MQIHTFIFEAQFRNSAKSGGRIEDLAITRFVVKDAVQTFGVLRFEVAGQVASDTKYRGGRAENHILISNLVR